MDQMVRGEDGTVNLTLLGGFLYFFKKKGKYYDIRFSEVLPIGVGDE